MVEGQAHRDTGRLRGRCALAAVACALLAAPAPAQEACAPWPGEPRPLPGLADPDPLRAQWALLRVRELAAAARALEPEDPARARALWLHARCIAPDDPELARGSELPLPSVIVHRPEVGRGDPAAGPADAWASLAAPIRVAAPPAPARERRPAPRPSAAATGAEWVDVLVDETAAHVRAAWFEAALASAERARQAVARLPSAARPARTARLEVQAATAALALGREQEARASLARALAANPRLRLDPGTTSPKVQRAFEAVRAEQSR